MEPIVKRSFSFALLVLHLLVFVIGGVLATESSAMASGRSAVVVATSTGADGPAIASADGRRPELGTRARGDRGDRRSGGLSLEVVLPRSCVGIGPAALVLVRDWRAAVQGHRSLPCVVNGARGPPPGR